MLKPELKLYLGLALVLEMALELRTELLDDKSWLQAVQGIVQVRVMMMEQQMLG